MAWREPTGERRWVAPDMTEMRIRQSQHRHQTTWIGVWLYLLKIGDNQSAALVRARNRDQ